MVPSVDPWETASERPNTPLPAIERTSVVPRSSRAPGMHMGHDLLLAVTMAVAFVLLGATTWFWTVR